MSLLADYYKQMLVLEVLQAVADCQELAFIETSSIKMTVINNHNNNENNIYQTHYIHFYLNLRFDWLIINLFISHLRFFFMFSPHLNSVNYSI